MTDPLFSKLCLASSEDKLITIAKIVNKFNELEFITSSERRMRVNVVKLESEVEVNDLLDGSIDAISPESSYWIDEIVNRSKDKGRVVTFEGITYFMLSPLVLAVWKNKIDLFEYPYRDVDILDIVTYSHNNKKFRWGHASPYSSGGLLSMLAIWGVASQGNTKELTHATITKIDVLEMIENIESSVSYYASSESDLFLRLLTENRNFLDAFILQEHFITELMKNDDCKEELIVLPIGKETVWANHPIALLTQSSFDPEKKEIYECFCEFLVSNNSQHLLSTQGFRPITSTFIDYITSNNEQLVKKGKTEQSNIETLNYSEACLMRSSFTRLKRRANIYLLLDTSASMQGEKLRSAQRALLTFLMVTEMDKERIGFIEFNSDVICHQLIDELSHVRKKVKEILLGLEANSLTALLEAIQKAYHDLQKINDKERINSIIVLTDGHDNISKTGIIELLEELNRGNQGDCPVVIYCIAYGEDADRETLEKISNATLGYVYDGTVTEISEIYAKLSRLF